MQCRWPVLGGEAPNKEEWRANVTCGRSGAARRLSLFVSIDEKKRNRSGNDCDCGFVLSSWPRPLSHLVLSCPEVHERLCRLELSKLTTMMSYLDDNKWTRSLRLEVAHQVVHNNGSPVSGSCSDSTGICSAQQLIGTSYHAYTTRACACVYSSGIIVSQYAIWVANEKASSAVYKPLPSGSAVRVKNTASSLIPLPRLLDR